MLAAEETRLHTERTLPHYTEWCVSPGDETVESSQLPVSSLLRCLFSPHHDYDTGVSPRRMYCDMTNGGYGLVAVAADKVEPGVFNNGALSVLILYPPRTCCFCIDFPSY